ncbi:xanthine dehydrogenase YagS FAD-binding subunit [Comamonas sp. BIGb0124]|uniref:FAD binding domain-containing protein n=1 Tax=Comamonas sp. BIGb0124 TaxID=2485130 RepID=UPI000F49AFFC|nr:xanthine dehydrogenase family protein subunit M [Comamonas sp. BIGb0124]ROR24731.1 xanthine dehydrogenase YagS FAD-binding subunit [Comamonas sp. BIGb0124]
MSGDVFDYVRPADLAEALDMGAETGSAYMAGGTDLMPLWKLRAEMPARVVDISRLPLGDIAADANLRLGALAKLSDVATDTRVWARWPLIVDAINASASGQVRNMATVGGALLQRTRCAYFRNDALPCNKRQPGSGCGARTGENRGHAIFGASGACVATHPSDLAVALTALDAEVELAQAGGMRRVAALDLYRLPGETPNLDTVLEPGELIAAVDIPESDGALSTYLKVRDRASFEFAVVSVAAVLRVEDEKIAHVRLVAGGVASRPWRLAQCEAALLGQRPTQAVFEGAAALAVEGAQALEHNGFKIELLRRAVRRALETVGGKT